MRNGKGSVRGSMLAWLSAAVLLGPLVVLIGLSGRVQAQEAVDATTLTGKYMCGYQGWFQCPGDGSGGGWFHWFHGQDPSYAALKCDLFPDLSEFADEELFATNMQYPDGSPVKLFSSYPLSTQMRHFRWMKEYDIDGVWVQRFGPRHVGWSDFTNRVLLNCKEAAETHGRVFTVMYDITGANNATLFDDLTGDWQYLVDTFKITESARYLNHNDRPLVAVWGMGFDDRAITPEVAARIIQWFKNDAPARYQATVMVGVVSNGAFHWRTLAEPWASTIRMADIISPWFVGSFGDSSGAEHYRANRIVPDIAECRTLGKEYLPVVFPGFSWANMTRNSANPGPRNQIPRLGGRFYWEQVYNAISAGATMLYGAMFDEVDEGTAILKACPRQDRAPADWWLTLDADGFDLPGDWYLRLAGLANRTLKNQIPLSRNMPIDPHDPDSNWVGAAQRYTAASNQLTVAIRNQVVHISLPTAQIITVTLTRLNGARVSSFTSGNARRSMQVPLFTRKHLPHGTYLLRITAAQQTLTRPVVYLDR